MPAFSNLISNAELIISIVDFFLSATFYKIDLLYGEKKIHITFSYWTNFIKRNL